MSSWLHPNPERLSPAARRVALISARAACVLAPLVAGMCVIAGVLHLVADVGNYPEPRHRYAVGALFLLVFAPVAVGIHLLAKKRARAIAAVNFAERKDPVVRR